MDVGTLSELRPSGNDAVERLPSEASREVAAAVRLVPTSTAR
jgi:hypothetical protein